MLKKKALRKIIITTFSIITIFIICIIPEKLSSNNNYLNPKIDTIYVDNDNTNQIYLLGPTNYLVRVSIINNNKELKDKIKEIINYLTIDKSNKIPEGLKGIIPKDTKLNNIEINDKLVILDFSKELLNISKNLEERLIEAIVYSLIDMDKIEKISIKVDGEELKELPSGKSIPITLDRSYGINKVFDITSTNNILKVVLYYEDTISSNKYYVPVTKYINDQEEKIKVIIDNLSSSYIYEPTLVSLLDENTKLLNYEISDNTMTLNFNNGIFTSNRLLEEVIYPVSISIFDNYNVENIIYEVEGKKVGLYQKCCGLKK